MTPARAGTLLAGRYALMGQLASGSEGEVWHAEQVLSRRPVILKRWRLPRRVTDGEGERFVESTRAHARLEHPGIVEVLDAGFDEADHAFVVMQRLIGETLETRLARGPLATAEALDVFTQLLDALAVAHGAGVVHRDLKPANVFLATGHRGERLVKLLDFGVALSLQSILPRVTPAGVYLGTPAYMAPEQLDDPAHVGPAADVWAVGVMLHQALADRMPFAGELDALLAQARAGWDPEGSADDLAPPWAALIARCLRPAPDERLADAAELAQALRALAPRRWPFAALGAAIAIVSIAVLASTNAVLVPLVTGQWGYWVSDHVWSPLFLWSGLVGLGIAAALLVLAWRQHQLQRTSVEP
ncbi:MAG: serine/threonine protein kinase [Sandaracinaceae bacterium]|nr:serine/threonine protein kinase [Sandaracinaceae bacterium]